MSLNNLNFNELVMVYRKVKGIGVGKKSEADLMLKFGKDRMYKFTMHGVR